MLLGDDYDSGETDKNASMFTKLDRSCKGYDSMLSHGTNEQLTKAFKLAIRPRKKKVS